MTVERLATVGLVVFGLIFIFVILPTQVETVDYGRIVPATVPMIALIVITVTAALQLIMNRTEIAFNRIACARAVLFITLMAGAVWLMGRVGFEYAAPVFALTVMLLIGEQRWYWLMIGGAVIPLGIWLITERLLDRLLA